MSDLLVITILFLNIINLVLTINTCTQLTDVRADLYYYAEVKCDGDDDGI